MDDFFKKYDDDDDIFSDFSKDENASKNKADVPMPREASRKEKVEKFVLKIDELPDYGEEKKMRDMPNRPAGNGEVYFANYQKNMRSSNNSSAPKKPVSPTRPRNPQPKKPAGGYDFDMFDENVKKTATAPQKRPPQSAGKNVQRKPVASQKPVLKKSTMTDAEKQLIRKKYSQQFYISLIIVAVFAIIFSCLAIDCMNDILALNGTDEEIEVTVPENITRDDAIDIFKDKNLIKNGWFCKLFSSYRDYEDKGKKEYGKLLPYVGGTYYMSSSMGIEGMLNTLIDSASASEETVTLSFPEGWTIPQMINRLEDYEVITDSNKFIKAMSYDYNYSFLSSRSNKEYLSLEGYLFPDTYEFYVGESTTSVIKRFLDNFSDKWTSSYDKRAKKIGRSVNEILTVASIIQKEAAGPSQMADIASVIYNRLDRSADYPMLQCDSTKLYVTKYISELAGSDKANKYLDLYDTNLCVGLPAGPICNPSIDAIKAALYPNSTSYLYFCHDKDGNVYYASNDIEHQQNVMRIGE